MRTLAVASIALLLAPFAPPAAEPIEAAAEPTAWFERTTDGFLSSAGGAMVRLDGAGATLTARNATVRLTLPTQAELVPQERAPFELRTYVGNDPAQWSSDGAAYARVVQRGAAPGIDVVWYGAPSGHLEFDAVVAPGADPAAFSLAVDGGAPAVEPDGALSLGPGLRLAAPIAFQDGSPVEARWRVEGDQLGFVVGEYDPTRTLVIDPAIVSATYAGTSADEFTWAGHARDAAGDLYLAGLLTNPTDESTKWVVSKYSPDIKRLLWRTTLGGWWINEPLMITTDAAGRPIVGGWTSTTDFPTTPGAARPTGTWGFGHAVIARLTTGGALDYGTYVLDGGHSSVADLLPMPDGSLYVAGYAWGGDRMPGLGYQPEPYPDEFPDTAWADAFVIRLRADGTAFDAGTYLGAHWHDYGYAIAALPDGDIILAGDTTSYDFPLLHPLDATFWPTEGFVARFSPDLATLRWSTYIGGSDDEWLFGDAVVDADGLVWITGGSASPDFPLQDPIYASSHGTDNLDAVLFAIDPDGPALAWSTYLGGSGVDAGQRLVATGGRVYVAGLTTSKNFPLAGAVDGTLDDALGPWEAFVSIVEPDASRLVHSSYYGGRADDWAVGLDVRSGDLTLSGATASSNLPGTGPPQPARQGAVDLFVARITLLSEPTQLAGGPGSMPARVRLTWEPPAEDGGAPVTSYRVYRQISGGPNKLLTTVPAHARTYEDDWTANNGEAAIPTGAIYRVTAVTSKAEGPSASLHCVPGLAFPSLIRCER